MKVETTNTEQFKPFELVITIESKKELDALIDMFKMNITIPDIVEKKHWLIIKLFLDETRDTLIERI